MKKEYRLKKNEDFSRVIKKRISLSNSTFIIYKDQNDLKHGRAGISVSKKLGNAVTRNKTKRQLRMMIKDVFHLEENFDYIVIVKKNFLNQSYIDNKKELESLYQKIRKRRINTRGFRSQN